MNTKSIISGILILFITACSGHIVDNQKNGPDNNSAVSDTLHVEKIQLHKAVTERNTEAVELSTYFELDSVFDLKNYHLEEVRKTNEVNRVFVHDIRLSLGEENTTVRKYDFMRIILSNALRVNEHVLKERHFLQNIQEDADLVETEQQRLDSLLERYNADTKTELLERIDIIPPSLIICQAILESGWGRSHFAYEGNSLFGQHAPVGAPNSMPAKGANVGLRAFPSIFEAILGYVHNLNRHHAYQSLRDVRKTLREKNLHVDGISLVNTEDHYSELGHEYVDRLREVISIYHLTDFDNCQLKDEDNLLVYILN